jgi:hypothetical protein
MRGRGVTQATWTAELVRGEWAVGWCLTSSWLLCPRVERFIGRECWWCVDRVPLG